jgi:hypothetical protein
MCGASQQQNDLAAEQTQAYQQAQQMTAQQYANQSAIYAPMTAQFQSILAKGPNQKGFSSEEDAALNAHAVEGTAQNYAGAAKAVNEQLATEGGGDSTLTSGSQAQMKQEVANSSAQTESNEEQQIEEANYSAGASEYGAAAGGLETIASGQNPIGYENAATGAGSAAETTGNQINEEDNSWINATIGAAGTVAGGWASGGFET